MSAFDRFYETYTASFPLRLAARALFSRSKVRRISLVNRQTDYTALAENRELLALHRRLNACLSGASDEWSSYDYGEGYFYQSFERIGVRGLRNTEERVAAMGLSELVTGRRVLEVGCNSGFLSLSIAESAAAVVGFDLNPFLIEMANATADHLGLTTAQFSTSSFEDFPASDPFDVVLSFANHSTFDGNTHQTLEAYFDRCRALLAPGGLLLFESHPPAHEGDGLEKVCEIIGSRFSIEARSVLDYGSFLDQGRTFIIARSA